MKDTIKATMEALAKGQRTAQGDVTLVPIDALPEGLVKANPENGLLIVAHSESGHHHAIQDDGFELYDDPNDQFVSYGVNRTDNVIELRHFKNYAPTHAPHGIPAGAVIKFIRGRETTPEGFRRVED